MPPARICHASGLGTWMTRDELIAKLQDHEDAFVERKLESLKPSDIRRAVVAFANSVPQGREAILFIGVADKGEILGCTNPDAKQKAVRSICEHDCYPPIAVTSEVLSTEKGAVVAVLIAASQDRPHFAGPAYVRKGSESVAASRQVFDELIYSRSSHVASILRHKNEVVSVESVQHKLGSTRHIASGGYREHAECRILECNAHYLRLQNISSLEYYSEPVSHVELVRDEEKYRAKLIVRG